MKWEAPGRIGLVVAVGMVVDDELLGGGGAAKRLGSGADGWVRGSEIGSEGRGCCWDGGCGGCGRPWRGCCEGEGAVGVVFLAEGRFERVGRDL